MIRVSLPHTFVFFFQETDDAKSEQALAEEEIKEERLQSGKQSDTTSSIQGKEALERGFLHETN